MNTSSQLSLNRQLHEAPGDACVAKPKRELNNRISEEVPFRAGLQAGVIPMLPVAPRANVPAARNNRWGVVLAGGDGTPPPKGEPPKRKDIRYIPCPICGMFEKPTECYYCGGNGFVEILRD